MNNMNKSKVLVVGAGLAGSEAAMYLASNGIQVVLAECKTKELNPAQKIPLCAELVCTNSLKSKEHGSAHGLLKVEMKKFNSIMMESAEANAVPAGGALAVDRENFSKYVTEKLRNNENIVFIDDEVSNPVEFAEKYGCSEIIIASGPLTTSPLESWIKDNIAKDDFYFYDAIAPVVDADSLDYSKLYYKDRHINLDEGEEDQADYLNAPMNKEEYHLFVNELVKAEKVKAKDFEDYKFFESCLPIDVMAERGPDTARFSCMKPIGLELPDGSIPHAVVQLRRENLLGSAFNLVGFQTRLTYKEQLRIFRMIPGLESATFNHLGSVHRNSFLDSKKVLNFDYSSKEFSNIYFAGQISGVEGYTESASMGIYVASQLLRKFKGLEPLNWPFETAVGALVNYVMTSSSPRPSNINFGLLPTVPLTKEQRRFRKGRKKLKKELAYDRGVSIFEKFYKDNFMTN